MMQLDFKANFLSFQEPILKGRYINSDHIKPLLDKHKNHFEASVLGKSVLGEHIHFLKIGAGKKRILMWSQMHGNESTTTKAVFDLLNLFAYSKEDDVKAILENCTIGIIPMLNPDGARMYTRLNANHIDLNRDAQNLTQPESKILKACFDDFKPDFCFNLHGQRTIFSAGFTNKPATVSFLAPAQDVDRSITDSRMLAMDVIVHMNESLEQVIPGQTGIYDDTYNINCVGDNFQTLDVPTILFEAGHYHEDYEREKVRGFIFRSLWVGLTQIVLGSIKGELTQRYFEIPQNEKLFYDIIIRNARLSTAENSEIGDIAIQYQEILQNEKILFQPKVEKIGDISNFFAHRQIDAGGHLVQNQDADAITEGNEIDFVLINNQKINL